MIRTLDTAYHVLHGKPSKILVWPDLREAHDAICNHGSPTINLIGRYPLLDFSECSEKWDYEQNTTENAQLRALRVRSRLERHSKDYKNILVVTHRGFITYLVSGRCFSNCGKTFPIIYEEAHWQVKRDAFISFHRCHRIYPRKWGWDFAGFCSVRSRGGIDKTNAKTEASFWWLSRSSIPYPVPRYKNQSILLYTSRDTPIVCYCTLTNHFKQNGNYEYHPVAEERCCFLSSQLQLQL
jgi:hypothetical protein